MVVVFVRLDGQITDCFGSVPISVIRLIRMDYYKITVFNPIE